MLAKEQINEKLDTIFKKEQLEKERMNRNHSFI